MVRVTREVVVAAILAVLIVASLAQTVVLAGFVERAKEGSITLKPTGALAERKSASAYSKPSAQPALGTSCG